LVSQRQDELDLRGRKGWPPALPSSRQAHPLHATDARRLAGRAATAVVESGGQLAGADAWRSILERLPGAARLLHRSDGLLERRGARGVLIARLVPLARTFVSLPAGARRVPLPAFVMMTAVGSAVWAAAFITAGVLAGTGWVAVSSIVGRVLLAAGLLIVALALLQRLRASG
jgi:membrane protein DedA with SNARE-associated domain